MPNSHHSLASIAESPFVVVLLPVDLAGQGLICHLSVSEREKMVRFRQEGDRHRYLVAHTLKRALLSHYARVGAEQLSFSENSYGKPACVNAPNIRFNLSHSGDWAVMTCSLFDEVGVDIEFTRDIGSDSLIDRICSQEESLAHKQQGLSLERFFTVWAQKEAISKAYGQGISLGLEKFSVSGTLGHEKITLLSESYDLWSRSHDDGILACATKNTDTLVQAPRWFQYDEGAESVDSPDEWRFFEL